MKIYSLKVLNTNKDLQDFIDSLVKEDLIDSRAKLSLRV